MAIRQRNGGAGRPGPAVVVSPLIALQEDQLDGLNTRLARRRPSPSIPTTAPPNWGGLASAEAATLPSSSSPRNSWPRSHPGPARGAQRLVVRGGRGALRVLLGSRFQARLPRPGRSPRAGSAIRRWRRSPQLLPGRCARRSRNGCNAEPTGAVPGFDRPNMRLEGHPTPGGPRQAPGGDRTGSGSGFRLGPLTCRNPAGLCGQPKDTEKYAEKLVKTGLAPRPITQAGPQG